MTVTVKYWIGTTQYDGKATTYRGAMRLAAKNCNAYGPTYYDENGVQLFDDGQGLAYEDEDVCDERGVTIRTYAV